MPKRRSAVAERGFDAPAPGIEMDDFARGPGRQAAGQAPGFLHAFGVDADDRAGFVALRRHRRRADFARPPARADPVAGLALLAIGGGNLATKQLLCAGMLPRNRMT